MSRPVFLYVALSLTCTGVLASACSGAETQDVLLGASGSSTSSSSSSSSSSSGSNGSSGTTSSSGTSGASGSGSCPREQEPNDDKDEPNALTPLLCGTLSGKSDREFLTFRLEPTAKTLAINFTGRIRLRVDVAGHDTTELTPDNAGKVPFVSGADYLIEVRSLTESNNDLEWRVEIVTN